MRPFRLDVENNVRHATYENQPGLGSLFELLIPMCGYSFEWRSRPIQIDGVVRKRAPSCSHPSNIARRRPNMATWPRRRVGSNQRRDFQKLERRFAALAH